MPSYDVSFRCKDCGRDHRALLMLHLEEGPERKQSVAEFFHGLSLPPQVQTTRWHKPLCPKTGRKFSVKNDSDIFLVPPWYLRRDPVRH